jgi:ATP-dependent DNA ligase
MPPSGRGWVHEIKHDGFRILARREGDRVRLFTCNGMILLRVSRRSLPP